MDEFVDYVGSRAVSEPGQVRIYRKSGIFGFPVSLIKKYDLKRFKYIVFAFNEQGFKIGIRFGNDPKREGRYTIIFRKSGAMVNGDGFLKSRNLEYIKGKAFLPEGSEEQKILVLSINKQ